MLRKVGDNFQSLVVLAALALLLGLASPHFLTADNLLNVAQQSAINALLGLGLTFVIISAGIDLSVGSVLAFCGLVVADLLVKGHGLCVAIGAGLLLGLLCGAVNGLVTTWARIPPFITTLGMMLVARSAARIYSDSRPISGLPDSFRALSSSIGGVPVLVLVVPLCFLAAHVVLTRTKLGRYTYAIGGNEQAAWLSGVAVGQWKVIIYALSGLMAGVAAVFMTSRLNAASPLAGEMYELYAIAAAVIGGVSLMGGEGRVVGTLIGALIMGMLRNGLNLLNVPSAWEGVVVGVVLVSAVIVDRARRTPDRTSGLGAGLSRSRQPLLVGAGALALLAIAGGYRLHHTRTRAVGRENLTLAFVPKCTASPFWKTMQEAAEQEARRLGVKLITLAPERETDVERQYQVVENLVRQGVDALILAPAGSRELAAAVRQANDAEVPVLLVDARLDQDAAAAVGARTLTYIGSDNLSGGRAAGRFLAQALGGRGQVAILEGTAGHETVDQRRLGFLEAVKEFPGITVVASQPAYCERERGYTVAQNLLQAHPELDGIFAANDEMALGALEAIDAARKLTAIKVVGFDAMPEAVAHIRSGRMLGSVAQFPAEMGRRAVAHAVALLRSHQAPPPEVLTPVEVISAANAADGQP